VTGQLASHIIITSSRLESAQLVCTEILVGLKCLHLLLSITRLV